MAMAHSGEALFVPAETAEPQSWLGKLVGLIAAKHVCVPPDGATPWQMASEQLAARRVANDRYACPECGQRLVRSTPPCEQVEGQPSP